MENINFEIFTTKKIEYYRYEISRLKNKEKLSKIDIQILRNSENAINMNKIITRGYYAFEIFLFLLRRKKLTSNKKAFAIFRLMTFGFLVNFFTNIYLIKKVSKLLNMNKIELTNVEDFRSFITHKNT